MKTFGINYVPSNWFTQVLLVHTRRQISLTIWKSFSDCCVYEFLCCYTPSLILIFSGCNCQLPDLYFIYCRLGWKMICVSNIAKWFFVFVQRASLFLDRGVGGSMWYALVALSKPSQRSLQYSESPSISARAFALNYQKKSWFLYPLWTLFGLT